MSRALDPPPPDPTPARPNVTTVYQAHGDFLWVTLQRLGVRDADRDDVLQEVLVVVHHRLHTFDGRGPMAAWLFGVCFRVAAAHRRRAYMRREQLWGSVPEDPAATGHPLDPEEALIAAQAQARLRAVLDEMDIEKRVVFVMYEIDEVPAAEIATLVGIPFNTVHSRLRAARGQFDRIAARHRARDARRSGVSVPPPWWPGESGPSDLQPPWQGAPRSLPLSDSARARHAALLPRVMRVRAGPSAARGAIKLLGGAGALALALAVWPRGSGRPTPPAPAPATSPAGPTSPAPTAPPTAPPSGPPSGPAAPPAPPRAANPPVAVPRPAVRAAPPPLAAPVAAPVVIPTPAGPGAGAGPTHPLDREVALLARAQAMLDDDPAGALAQMEQHAAESPRGELAAEREFLAVRALLRLGRRAEATARADALLARDPRGPFVRRVRRMLDEAPDAAPTNR